MENTKSISTKRFKNLLRFDCPLNVRMGDNFYCLVYIPNGGYGIWLLIMIFFVILRLLDTLTTILNINKYGGWEVELNPLMRFIGGYGTLPVVVYQLLMTLFAILVISRFKYKRFVFGVLSGVSLVAVVINIYCLTL